MVTRKRAGKAFTGFFYSHAKSLHVFNGRLTTLALTGLWGRSALNHHDFGRQMATRRRCRARPRDVVRGALPG